jgi:protocatechuate 3,4-dioxygenase beta subunit
MRRFWATGLLLAMAAWAADNQPPVPCSLSGSVVNAVTGEPLKKAQLTLRDTASDSSYTAATDEAGAFCLVAAEAATYELIIQKTGFAATGQTLKLMAGQATSGAIIRIAPQGVIAGRVTDRDGDPISGVSVQAIQSHSMGVSRRYSVAGAGATNDLGEYRIYGLNPGRYYVGGSYRGESGYAAIYYPNAHEASRAVAVDVPAGGEARGLNLTVSEIYSTRIRGTVQRVDGLPAKGVEIVAAPCDAGPLNRATTTVQKSDGAFELRDLTPGCYMLAADVFSGGKRYSARLPLTVAGQNIDGVNLSLALPVQLTGRVHIEGAADFPFRQVIVNLEARSSRLTAGGASSEDGSLLLNNIVPEVYELNVIVPEGYYLKSAKYGEADVLRFGLDLSHGATGRLDLEIGADGGRIEGSVADGDGRPIDGARVALIADDPGGGPSRLKVTVSNPKGAFSIRGIAPGDYKLYASRSLDVGALQDPDYVKQLDPQAKTVSIHEHGLEALSVKALAVDAIPPR